MRASTSIHTVVGSGCGVLTLVLTCSPNCPQNYVDVGYLLRIPQSQGDVLNIAQDEFDCLSINIVAPLAETTPPTNLLPVIVWIHGTLSDFSLLTTYAHK